MIGGIGVNPARTAIANNLRDAIKHLGTGLDIDSGIADKNDIGIGGINEFLDGLRGLVVGKCELWPLDQIFILAPRNPHPLRRGPFPPGRGQ